jgi:hypothetical protein
MARIQNRKSTLNAIFIAASRKQRNEGLMKQSRAIYHVLADGGEKIPLLRNP